MTETRTKLVIIGGGFAGVTLAQQLERLLPEEAEIVVVSSENHMVFTPMLAEVAGRTISPLHVVVPGRQLTRRTRWLVARVTAVDRDAREVHYTRMDGTAGSETYGELVLACGAAANLREIPGLAACGFPLKSVIDAIAIGNRLIGNFETAATETDPAIRQRLLTTVVIGGGFSGVELAGNISDLTDSIRCFYPELKHETPRIVLLQRGDHIVPELQARALSEFALDKLRQNGIDVRLKSEAKEVTPTSVTLASGEVIETGMIICTVGTQTHPLVTSLDLPLERGRLKTDPDMKVSGADHLWALGDCALIANAYNDRPSPSTAQFAVQQAAQLAANLARFCEGRPTRPFSYRPRGMFASIGHHNAVAEIYGVKISGFVAWFLWRGLYLFKLPTLKRKIDVAINWAVSIPFPPNIVQLQRPMRDRDAGSREETIPQQNQKP
ncbi:MAG TPA: FAD-dependent oxidoreductase [Chthoniobacteraceae bacterium]|nr:FAD-dependent oxidoreductase [Chthoniobacteraceae bacterium]